MQTKNSLKAKPLSLKMSRALANKKKIFRYRIDEPSEFSNSFSDIKKANSTPVEGSYVGVKDSSSPHVSKVIIAVVFAAAVVAGIIATIVVVSSSNDESKERTTTAIPHSGPTSSASTQTTALPETGNRSYEWSSWGVWTQCTATCESGIHKRYRRCMENITSLCLGDLVETKLCPGNKCPVYGKWTTWSSWGSCNATCDRGTQIRTRTCSKVDALDRDCIGDIIQDKTCSNWSCPDCNRQCTTGVLNDRCDTCICENNHTMGRVFSKSTNNPLRDAALYSLTAPTQLLALTNSTGFFSLNFTCNGSEILITKEGFIDTIVTISSTNMAINLTRVVKPVLTEAPESKYRLQDENVTFCCKASASPDIRYYEWFKDNVLLDKRLYIDQTKLSLKNLSLADGGNYQCRANSETGAIISAIAVLHVADEPNNFCLDALQQKQVMLPAECTQPGSSKPEFEVGKCFSKRCRRKTSDGEEMCRDSLNFCCSVKEYAIETINCTDFELDLFVVKSCGCSECESSQLLISGVVKALEDESPVVFASVLLNGNIKDYTTTTGTFRFRTEKLSSRWTITVEDNFNRAFLPTTKVFEVYEDMGDSINIEIRMIKPANPVEIDSTIENTLTAGSSDFSNVSKVQITVPANAFYYENGSQFNGNAVTRLTFLDPSDIANVDNIPGEFNYIDNEGQTGNLVSFGVFNLFFEDHTGKPLNLNQDVNAYIPIQNNDRSTFENFELWTLNSLTGIWEVETLPTKRVRRKREEIPVWIGSLSDISKYEWYNYDEVYQLTNKQCFFKVRVFRDEGLTQTYDNDMIDVRTRIIREGTLHTIRHSIYDPSTECLNVACEDELAYITGKTNKQVLLASDPYPSSSIDYTISDDKTRLTAKMTSSSIGPLYPTRSQCLESSPTDSYLSLNYGFTNYEWKFIGEPTKCNPLTDLDIDPLVSLRYWYPFNSEHGFRVCFVKIRMDTHGIDLDTYKIRIRVFSYGGEMGDIKDLLIGIHESRVDNNSKIYCIEYRCSGIIDTCFERVIDKTKVRILLDYPRNIVDCYIEDIAQDLKSDTSIKKYYDFFEFSARFEHGDDELGIYSENHELFEIEDIAAKAKKFCMSGSINPLADPNNDSGYAVSFHCHMR